MKLTQTIAFRLFLLIAFVQTLILVALTFAAVRIQQAHMMENVLQSAGRVSDVIARSTRHSMLLNRKEEVHSIVTSVGGEPGIEGIRIYNKQGQVVFATVPADLYTSVDMHAEACISCHTKEGTDFPHPSNTQLSRLFTKSDGTRVLGLITPIRNEQQCSDAACHAHPTSKTILGVLDVKMKLSQVDERLQESRQQLLTFSVAAVILVSLISGGFIWMVMAKPVRKLTTGMEMVSSGELGLRVEETSNNEIGQLARTFNSMTGELARAREQLTAWSNTLEQKIDEKTSELEKAHGQMIKVERMTSLGGLASTVAHELNNPLEGILTFSKLLIKRVRKSSLTPTEIKDYEDVLTLMADEAQRCGNIVKNLLLFSRERAGSFRGAQLKPILERCVLLMNHHAEMHNVKLVTECVDDDVIECDPNQIQQALVALMVNAVEAMSMDGERGGPGGTLTVAIARGEDSVTIRVSDTGVGIADEVKAHIFEPFFTTKSEGKGVGLGLSVVYGIVERHHGSINVESVVGRGTTFTMLLPFRQPAGTAATPVTKSPEGVS